MIINVFKPLPQILENVLVKDKNIVEKSKCKLHKNKKIMGSRGRILVENLAPNQRLG